MHRSAIISAILLLCAAFICRAQLRDSYYDDFYASETASSMMEHVRYLSSPALKGRAAGSEGESLAAAYLTRNFEKSGLQLLSGPDGDIFGIKQESGDTLTSCNVVAFIPGYDKELRNEHIVIGARLDNLGVNVFEDDARRCETVFCGANGNASGLAMLLRLAENLQRSSVLLKRSVVFVAFGASVPDNAGSWYFVNRSFSDPGKIAAMINLDMLGTGSNGFYAYTSSNEDLNALLVRMNDTLQPVKPETVSAEPVRSDHRSFYSAGIPSVFFTTGMYPEYNSPRDLPDIVEYDGMERELEYIYNFTLELANGSRPSFVNAPKPVRENDSEIYSIHDCDVPPVFLGSRDPVTFMQKWVYVYQRYPSDAVRDGIQGRVLVDFVIDEKGKVRDARVLRGLCESIDAEALRLINSSPDWKPARVRGKKVKCEMSLYIEFKLKRNY